MTTRGPNLKRTLRIAAALLGASAALGACTHTDQDTVTGSIPNDYRLRHPIVVQEANRTTEVFVGTGRGGLTAAQRSDIAGLAETWLREGTGGIIIDMPVNTPNARVAADSLREIRGILAAAGVPPHGVAIRNYRPTDPRQFATIRVNYPRITADAGPCGVWPEDLGPSIKNKGYLENRPYYNLGCASQRNLAAMVDNPSDLVQPRAETPAYTPRRNVAFDKYRKGNTTTTTYPEADKAKLSEVGK
ncbi:Flp pilus assembly protein CpaD [Bradyrhizobiaceae bacterium SG-6C]|nr:Flp pilus assembly protein CpaD [Bradyrhizobiaceae bacterium SG-6C]